MSFFREQRRIIGRRILQTCRSLRYWMFGKHALPDPDYLPQRILIIRSFFLGDILLCLPIAQAIKNRRPDTQISWLLREEWADLLHNHSVVDEVISFSPKKMHSMCAPGEFIRVARELRQRSFDITINLSWDRSSMLWSWITNARWNIGIEEYGRPRLLSLLHTHTVIAPERSQDERPMVDFYYEPLRILGFEARKEAPHIFPTQAEQQRMEERLKSRWNEISPFILIHPGGRLLYKRWPVERFTELIHVLQKETPYPIVLVCGPGEELWTADLAAAMASKQILFWPTPSLGELMALAQQAVLFIGNDSGPMHLAAACGCRVAAITGSQSKRWHPTGNHHQVITGENGVESVKVKEVIKAVLRILENTHEKNFQKC